MSSAIGSASFFVSCDSLIKLAIQDGYPPLRVLCMRGIAAALLCCVVMIATGVLRRIGAGLNSTMMLRALLETTAVTLFILALAQMPIGDVTAMMQVTPLLFRWQLR